MNFLKKSGKYLFRTILVLILAILLYVAAAYTFSIIPVNTAFHESENGIEIFVKSNGVHTDIVVPVTNELIDWKQKLKPEHFQPAVNEFKYLSIGWGDKGFYLYTPTWDDLKYSTAFKAMFWLSSSAVHATYYERAPIENQNTKKIKISKEQYQKLIEHIEASFQKNDKGEFLPINCCHYDGVNDNFYEANGTYNLFRTCNTWTIEGLKTAGVRTAFWGPFEWSVMRHLK